MENSRYNSLQEWAKQNPKAYKHVRRESLINKLCEEFDWKKPKKKIRTYNNGHWNFDNCRNEAFKFKSRSEFNKTNPSAYGSARKNKWLDEICVHMSYINKKSGFWNVKENCVSVIKDCSSLKEFINKYPSAYQGILKNKWDDELMVLSGQKRNGYWTIDKCHESALKCKTRKQFQTKFSSSYQVSRKNNWLEIVCSHMIIQPKRKIIWTKEKCLEESKKCETRGEFKKLNVVAYQVSRKNNWLDEFFPKKQ